jgi:hypothetical protein
VGKTKYKKIDYEKMISGIKEGQKNTAHCDKTGDPALFNMITKSLALLTQFPHGHDTELATEYKLPKQELEKYLIKLWGKPITEHEYHSILNQC